MVRANWKPVVNRMAQYVHEEMFEAHRGVIATDTAGTWAAFGNDGYASDARSQREVTALREHLLSNGAQLLGFAVHNDCTWLLLFRPTNDMSQDDLAEILWNAWLGGCPADEGDVFRHVQETVAHGCISSVGFLATLA